MGCKTLVALVALAGCMRSGGGKTGVALAGIGAASGFLYGVSCADYTSSDHNCDSAGATALGFAILGAVIGGVALAIVSEQHYQPPVVPEPAWGPPPYGPPLGAVPYPPPAAGPYAAPQVPDGEGGPPALYEPIQARDPMARQLTLQAHRAATQNQCAGIPAAAARVQALDAQYYARVFAPDPAIARCPH